MSDQKPVNVNSAADAQSLLNVGLGFAKLREQIIRKAYEQFYSMPQEEREKATASADHRRAKLSALSPQEKFARMQNPTCLDDYGLMMTYQEICAVPEAKREIEAWVMPNVELSSAAKKLPTEQDR